MGFRILENLRNRRQSAAVPLARLHK
jgi:hypothetical protein